MIDKSNYSLDVLPEVDTFEQNRPKSVFKR